MEGALHQLIREIRCVCVCVCLCVGVCLCVCGCVCICKEYKQRLEFLVGVSPEKVPSMHCVCDAIILYIMNTIHFCTLNLINSRSTASSEQVFEGQSQKKTAKAQHTNCVIS